MRKTFNLLSQPIFLLGLFLLACSNPPQSKATNNPPLAPEPEPTQKPVEEPATPVASVPPVSPPAAPATKSATKKEAATKEADVPVSVPAQVQPPEMTIEAGLHDAWDQLLRRHVSAKGKVNYEGFKADKTALDAYLQALSDNPPAETWSRAEKMAYWINAYNAFTIDLITDNYPISSILKLDNGKTWEVKRISLGGKKYSLNQIENEILRPQFKDARIHFAVNCAAESCPPLLNKAYTAEHLTSTLEQRTRQFINDKVYNSLAADKASVSKIFEWYAADFGDLRGFLNKYAATQLDTGADIGFKEYDWDLND